MDQDTVGLLMSDSSSDAALLCDGNDYPNLEVYIVSSANENDTLAELSGISIMDGSESEFPTFGMTLEGEIKKNMNEDDNVR